MCVEYPGYGLAPGSPSADAIDRHVRAAYDHFTVRLRVRPERVVLFGASVGTGPAARLAAAVQAEGGRVGALIMQSPYTCVRDAAAERAESAAASLSPCFSISTKRSCRPTTSSSRENA